LNILKADALILPIREAMEERLMANEYWSIKNWLELIDIGFQEDLEEAKVVSLEKIEMKIYTLKTLRGS
jgi:hypothetical protein